MKNTLLLCLFLFSASGLRIHAELYTGPYIFADWRQAQFNSGDIEDDTISGLDAAPAKDGVSNFLKYALYSSDDPFDPMTPIAMKDLVTGQHEDGLLRLVYPERIAARDVEYIPEFSEDLIVWNGGSSHVAEVGDRIPDGNGFELVTVEALQPEGAAKGFMRLRVEPKPVVGPTVTMGVFIKEADGSFTQRPQTLTIEVGDECFTWTRTAPPHGEYTEPHDHYNAADETSYVGGVLSWTEYGPAHSEQEIDDLCDDGIHGTKKAANSTDYFLDHGGFYLKIINVEWGE